MFVCVARSKSCSRIGGVWAMHSLKTLSGRCCSTVQARRFLLRRLPFVCGVGGGGGSGVHSFHRVVILSSFVSQKNIKLIFDTFYARPSPSPSKGAINNNETLTSVNQVVLQSLCSRDRSGLLVSATLPSPHPSRSRKRASSSGRRWPRTP